VNNARGVRGRESYCGLDRDVNGIANGKRAGSFETFAERFTLDEFGREEMDFIHDVEIEHREDIRMIERRNCLSLAAEALQPAGIVSDVMQENL
jgi:hypothetical protein